mgnify:CR=1 FL=1
MKPLLGAICLSTITTLLCLGLAEAAVRILDIGPKIMAVNHGNYRLSENLLLRYELAPGTPDGDAVINSHGMRDREFSTTKPDGTFRIACIGDSVTYGFGIDRSTHSYPKRLETLLNSFCSDSKTRFEVLNFGVPGYDAAEIAETARQKVLPFHPDLVIYGYCLNDPQETSLEFLKILAEMTHAQRHYYSAQTHSFLMRHSRVFRLASYILHRSAPQGKSLGEHVFAKADPENAALQSHNYATYFSALHEGGDGRRNLERSLDTLAAVCTQDHIPVCVFIFPVTNNLDPYPLSETHRLVADLCKARSFHVYDLLEDFRAYQRQENRGVYFDYLHPDTPGAQYTATAILSGLLQESMLPSTDTQDVKLRLLQGSPEDRDFAQLARLLPAP